MTQKLDGGDERSSGPALVLPALPAVPLTIGAIDPEMLLTREQAANMLTAAGYPVRPATLATMATRGGGPSYHRFGNKPLYRWGVALDWAKSRLGPLQHNTSEVKPQDAA